jgi:hypothetical protein
LICGFLTLHEQVRHLKHPFEGRPMKLNVTGDMKSEAETIRLIAHLLGGLRKEITAVAGVGVLRQFDELERTLRTLAAELTAQPQDLPEPA